MAIFNAFTIVVGLLGLTFYGGALLMEKKPARNINHLYGYRTKASMASQERWDYAQVYSSRLMQQMGQLLMLFAALWIFVPVHFEIMEVLASIAITISSCIYLLMSTEKALKKTFGPTKA